MSEESEAEKFTKYDGDYVPSYKGPKLDKSATYRLCIGNEFVTRITPLRLDKDRNKAKHFSGAYLQITVWDWWNYCVLDKVKADEKPVEKEELPPPNAAAAFNAPEPGEPKEAPAKKEEKKPLKLAKPASGKQKKSFKK